MALTELDLLARVGTGFGLSFVLGFERQLRGSIAGDRTFAVVGVGATAVTAVAAGSSPQAIAGVLTGIGFIGAGVVFRGRTGTVHGITTAATLFAVAGLGVVVGYAHLLLGLVVAIALLLVLELPNLPGLRVFDARRYAGRFLGDPDLVAVDRSSSADHRPVVVGPPVVGPPVVGPPARPSAPPPEALPPWMPTAPPPPPPSPPPDRPSP